MKKKFSPEDFLTRAEKIKSIEFPVSDSNRIIVLPNNEVFDLIEKKKILYIGPWI